jgi:uncharacterized membrane protein
MTSPPTPYNVLRQPDLLARLLLLLWSAALLAAIAAAPLAAAAARPEGWFLYQVFEPFCHQYAERSWHLQGYPLAVCARCAGVYAGLFLAPLLRVWIPARTIATALALLGASWAAEFTGLAPVSANRTRFVTGLALGCSVGVVLLSRAPRRVIRTRSAPLPLNTPQ